MANDPLEMAWKMHAALADWIGKADSKASFALTAQSATLALLGILVGSGRVDTGSGSDTSQALLWAGALFLAGGAACAAVTVSPNLRKERRGANADDDFLFFGHLRSWAPTELETALRDKDPLPALSRQLVVMSEVAWTKHRWVQWSFVLAAAGAITLGLAAATR
ncbi:Pycsar system effector family protein [Streptomyces sp. VNUA116]|uniref:Pycsar system effector family protein n=1 Tax=Streptomyces sp. VNUA116 TaxID=3062449 RepID=UPI0034A07403